MPTKIKTITEPETWTHKGRTMYQANVTLEDGQSGQVNMQTADRWKVGDDVEVLDIKETQYGPKIRLQKPGFDKPSNGFKPSGARETLIDSSWAVGHALNALREDLDFDDPKSWKNKVFKLATELVEVRDAVVKANS